MVDVLLRRYALISTLSSKLLVFKHIQHMYTEDNDFTNVYNVCENYTFQKFYRHNIFLFKDGKLRIPNCSLQELLVCKAYSGD